LKLDLIHKTISIGKIGEISWACSGANCLKKVKRKSQSKNGNRGIGQDRAFSLLSGTLWDDHTGVLLQKINSRR
jgi:hypothetical protein